MINFTDITTKEIAIQYIKSQGAIPGIHDIEAIFSKMKWIPETTKIVDDEKIPGTWMHTKKKLVIPGYYSPAMSDTRFYALIDRHELPA